MWIRIDLGAIGTMQLEVNMGRCALGVSGVADKPDQLPGFDVHPACDPGCESPTLAVVGAGGVVVEVDVVGGPPVVVLEAHGAAVPALLVVHPAHGAGGRGEHRRHLGAEDVGALMGPAATVATGTPGVRIRMGIIDREHHLVNPRIGVPASRRRCLCFSGRGNQHRCRDRHEQHGRNAEGNPSRHLVKPLQTRPFSDGDGGELRPSRTTTATRRPVQPHPTRHCVIGPALGQLLRAES